jgi:acrylyl-CoA reductase (NADPH)
MIIGTAGFTAMESVLALEDRGLERGAEVLVTGPTGGVGSQAVAYPRREGLPSRGLDRFTGGDAVAARTRRHRVIGRDVADSPGRVLASETWAGAIDCVGGETLAQILRSLRYGAAVAASGLVASAELVTTVYPFITRSVALLGIDSVEATTETRERVWSALGAVARRPSTSKPGRPRGSTRGVVRGARGRAPRRDPGPDPREPNPGLSSSR